jgi:RNA polymerase sigma-70 factor (ECF subfamily)
LFSEIDIHQDLIDQCRKGEPKAQFQLYNLYSKQMLNIAYRIINNKMEAEDTLQESFITAFTKLNSFRGDSSFGAWLKRIVINKSINVVRKKREFYVELNENILSEQGGEDFNPDYSYNVSDIKQALLKLSDGYRVVFLLFMFENYSHLEIAEELNISVNTSKSQLSRAKLKLKSIIVNQ